MVFTMLRIIDFSRIRLSSLLEWQTVNQVWMPPFWRSIVAVHEHLKKACLFNTLSVEMGM